MIKKNINILVSLMLLFFATSSFSQESYYVTGDTIFQIYRLQEVVVYSNRDHIQPCKIIELDQQQIKARNSTTISQLLNFEPGLNFIAGYKGETEVKIRGFRSHDVLVLLDGRPINPGYYGKVDLSMLPLSNVAKITVIKGPASVAFGANSVGGVINIVTKNGFETPQTTMEAKFGDYQFRSLNLNHSQKIGNINYWISGYEQHALGFRMSSEFLPNKYEDGEKRNLSSYHKTGLSGKIAYIPNTNFTLTLSSDYSWAKKDIPVATQFLPGSSPRYWNFPNWERYSAAMSGEWIANSKFLLKSIFFVDSYNDRLIEYKDSNMSPESVEWNSLLKNFTTGGSIHAEFKPLPAHQLNFGIQSRHDQMHKKPDIDETWQDHFINTSSLFLQDDYQPWKKTSLALGIGYHVFHIESGNVNSNIAPFLSVQQTLFGNWQVFTSYSHTIRYPTLNQLYSQTSGNPELKAEYAEKFEFGLRKIFIFSNQEKFCSIYLALFYNKMDDLIYRATRSLRYINISQAKMQGVEFSAKWSRSKYISGEFSYSFIDIVQSALEIKDYLPQNKAHILVSAKTKFGSAINYEFTYFDQRKYYFINTKAVTFPEFFVHNVNIIQQITNYLTLRLEISNVMDEYYEQEYGYPQPGRQILGGFGLKF